MKRLERDLKADAMSVDACALSADWEAERSKKGDPPGVFITADPKTNAPFFCRLRLKATTIEKRPTFFAVSRNFTVKGEHEHPPTQQRARSAQEHAEHDKERVSESCV
jgi:hypothetical protein